MRIVSILTAVVVVVLAARNFFAAQDVVATKQEMDDCLDLETRLAADGHLQRTMETPDVLRDRAFG